MPQILTHILIVYLIIINVIAFIVYGIDKYKAKNDKWRIPEATLIGFAGFGGALGALVGMNIWHHKTRKPKFFILVPLFLVIWIVILFFLFTRFGLTL